MCMGRRFSLILNKIIINNKIIIKRMSTHYCTSAVDGHTNIYKTCTLVDSSSYANCMHRLDTQTHLHTCSDI